MQGEDVHDELGRMCHRKELQGASGSQLRVELVILVNAHRKIEQETENRE